MEPIAPGTRPPRTALVTGATSGFGRAAAEALARDGTELFLVCRNAERAGRAAEEVRESSGNPAVHPIAADLRVRAEVRRAAEAFLASGRPLHLLLNNAGAVFGIPRGETVDGVEQTLALNHLAYFELTLRLLERLRESAPAKVVNVASDGYTMARGRFDFDDYNAGRRYGPARQYGASKLANILFTRELARRLEGSGVTTLSWSPTRLTATRFCHDVHPVSRIAMALLRPFALSTERAVPPLLALCRGGDPEEQHGRHFSGARCAELRPAARNDGDARRLWELSAELTGVEA